MQSVAVKVEFMHALIRLMRAQRKVSSLKNQDNADCYILKAQ